jgi:hypothetical protein
MVSCSVIKYLAKPVGLLRTVPRAASARNFSVDCLHSCEMTHHSIERSQSSQLHLKLSAVVLLPSLNPVRPPIIAYGAMNASIPKQAVRVRVTRPARTLFSVFGSLAVSAMKPSNVPLTLPQGPWWVYVPGAMLDIAGCDFQTVRCVSVKLNLVPAGWYKVMKEKNSWQMATTDLRRP